MKKEFKKLLKRLFVGAVAAITIISTLSVNSTYAATADKFYIYSADYQSIYRVAKRVYMDRVSTPTDKGGMYIASKESYNTYAFSGGFLENFYEVYCAKNTKKTAYNLVYNAYAHISGMDEAPKAFRYFLYGGADPLEEDDWNYWADDKGKVDTYMVKARNEIDQKIIDEQTNLYNRYTHTIKHPINVDGYNVKCFGANSTNAFESRLYFIDMDKLLNTSSNASSYYKSNLKDLSNYILQNKDEIPTNGSQVQIETTGNGITVLNGDTNIDWNSTLGVSFGDMLSRVSKKNDENNKPYYEVELNYCLQDMYKWPGQRTFFGIQETDLNKLHLMGLSQDFRMFGSFEETIRVYPNGQVMCKDSNSNTYISIDNRTSYKSDTIN